MPLLHSATGTYTLELGPALGSASSPLASRECPLLLQGVQGGVASGSRSLSAGAFAAVRWNESTSQEEYYWIDVHTGATTVLGTVGDLAVIPYGHPVAVDNRRGRLYVVGAPESSGSPAWTLYTLDTHSGALVRKAPLQGTPAASYIAANGAGEILGLRWNDGTSDEEVVRIDPHTGAQTLLGTVGDLLVWSGQLAVDEAHDRLYVVGSPVMGASTWKLYALSATTGELLSSPALTLGGAPLDQLLGLAANSEGALFGFRWNGTKEEMLSVDPATGVATVVGTVGDLAVWSTTSALNPTSDTLYVVGNDGASDELYVMDARTATGGTDRFLYSTSIAKYPTAGVLVYRGRPRPTN